MRSLFLRVFASVAASAAPAAPPAGAAVPGFVVPAFAGGELAAPAPGSGAGIVFVDAMKQAAPWTSAQPLALDHNGNVVALRPGQSADATVYAGESYPAGDYTLLYDGRATFAVRGASLEAQAPGRAVVHVAASGASLHLRLLATDPANYARNVRLILPGFEATYSREPFHPAFLRSLAGTPVLRFGAWMQADTFALSAPAPNRPAVDRFTQSMPGGVAVEYAVALANATGKTPWFALPVGATNLYVSQFAGVVSRALDPRLGALFQYGGDVWRPGTPGNAWAASAGHDDGVAGDPQSAALDWYALRSKQVFALVRRAFGAGAGRVTRVVTGPAADATGLAQDRALIERIRGAADAFAFARSSDASAGAAALAAAHAGGLAAILPDTAQGAPEAAWTPRAGAAEVDAYRAPLESIGHEQHPHRTVVPAYARPRDVAPASGPDLELMAGRPMERVDLAREGNEDWFRLAGTPALQRAPHGDGALRLAGPSALDAPAGPVTRILRVYVAAARAKPMLRAVLSDGSAAPGALAYESRFGPSSAVYTVRYRSKAPAATLHVSLAAGGSGRAAIRAAALHSAALPDVVPAPSDMTTYHNDLSRSGWDPNEYALNESTVSGRHFGLLQTLHVQGDVLAQPLYLAGYDLGAGLGTRNVLIVATEHDVVYEFDADSGTLLNSRQYGTPQSSSDIGCGDIEPEYGITSTPVIDRRSGVMYFVTANEGRARAYESRLFEVNIATLEPVGMVALGASAKMSNGSTLVFNAAAQQNRTGLVLNNGNVYVGIGSHCDFDFGGVTGWMLAYDSNLQQTAALPMGEDTNAGLLNSIWMTGFASAVDGNGNLYAVTGNGTNDASAGGTNYGESAVKMAPNLSSIESYFTPTDFSTLDAGDSDFGSGGIMLLPPQDASVPNLAVAMGKDSHLYLLDTDSLGGLGGFVQTYAVPGYGEWGGPAYYNGPTGQFIYYQSGGAGLCDYLLRTASTGTPYLTLSTQGASGSGYGGSLPIVSSNGQFPESGVVWLVQRNSTLRLEAYAAREATRLLFAADAGVWTNPENNGFVTPLVANGRVYVPATGTVAVFGLH